jgi:hypothetical protein
MTLESIASHADPTDRLTAGDDAKSAALRDVTIYD